MQPSFQGMSQEILVVLMWKDFFLLSFYSKPLKLIYMKTELIIEVMFTTLAVVKLKPEKRSSPEQNSKPRPLRYLCSALPTELSSHLGAGHFVSL